MLNGTSNGHVNSTTNGTALNGVLPKSALEKFELVLSQKSAVSLANQLDHTLGPFKKNGDGKDVVYTAQCSQCLCLAVIRPSGATGVALSHPCDASAKEKNIEFTREPMSAEHRKRVTAPWKHPAEK